MKRYFLAVLLMVAIVLPSCTNLDDLYRRLDDYESRLAKVEKLTEGANRDIIALKALIDAQNKKLTIADWRPLDDNSGYVLTMSDGSKITLKNGADGINSAIGVRRSEDGILYWTLNGEYMYDPDGNKIKAEGIDGANGVTPQLRVNKDNYWEYSLDGVNWLPIKDENHRPVKATGESGDSDLNIDNTSKPGYIIITFKGKTYEIPLNGNPAPINVTIEFVQSEITITPNTSGKIEFVLKPDGTSADNVTINWVSDNEAVVKILNNKGDFMSLEEGEANITASVGTSNAICKVIVKGEGLKKVDFEIIEQKKYPGNAQFLVKSPDPELKYTLLCNDEETYDTYGKDRIHEDYVKAGWKKIFPNGDDWKYYIPVYQSQGDTEEWLTDMGATPVPGKKYVVYVYGLNDEGDQTTEVVEYRFSLPEMQKIEGFTFDITTIDPDNPDGPIFNIKPSNDSYQYVLYVDKYSVYESRKDDPEALDLLALEIARSSVFMTKGECTFGPGEVGPGLPFYKSLKSKLKWADYALFVYGYEEEKGVTTPIQVIKIPKRK